jgi:hypothetical protein
LPILVQYWAAGISPLGSVVRIGTADFDLAAAGPYKTAKAVELLI